ncbi:hypothetical protein ACIOD2_02225 [Amycolatopsis sp. NPDC088138]
MLATRGASLAVQLVLAVPDRNPVLVVVPPPEAATVVSGPLSIR